MKKILFYVKISADMVWILSTTIVSGTWVNAHLVRMVTYCNTVTVQSPAQYVQYIDVLMQ